MSLILTAFLYYAINIFTYFSNLLLLIHEISMTKIRKIGRTISLLRLNINIDACKWRTPFHLHLQSFVSLKGNMQIKIK